MCSFSDMLIVVGLGFATGLVVSGFIHFWLKDRREGRL